jgi:GMP synthase (glutamine-hydrolysing)
MKTLVAIRHVPFEDLGLFQHPALEAGFNVTYRDAGVDSLDIACDLLVVMGGPISAYEEDKYPFLADELSLLEKRLGAGEPVLGVCLGAQLMARALGARVYAGNGKEIGWKPVTLSAAGLASPLAILEGATLLHWHGDTFDLPAGATLLASTDPYANQAFSHGDRALALQFHAEVDARCIEQWLIGHACELSHSGIDLATLRRGAAQHGADLTGRAAALFRAWATRAMLI